MMKKIGAVSLACLLAASALLSGCGKSNDKGDASSSGGSEYKSIGYVCSALGDKSFTDLSWSGIQRTASDLGMTAKAIE